MASLNSNTRTNAAEVEEIFSTSLSSDKLNQFINMAATVTDRVKANDVNDELDSTALEQIEMNIAAHFASSRDQMKVSESVGDAEYEYKGPTDTTEYWETAVLLDTTGTLSDDGQPNANIHILNSRGL